MTDTVQMKEMMWKAVKVSITAGKAILKVYHSGFSVSSKADDSPLTQADMESHALISEALSVTGLPVLSEEGRDIPWEQRKSWSSFWLVDPLDGTKEFVNRNGEFTVNIALIEDNFPVAGVIYVPVDDELFVGMGAMGAYSFLDAGEVVKACTGPDEFFSLGLKLPAGKGKREYTVAGSRSHMSAETTSFINELRQAHGKLNFISRGSSLKLCMVATGTADIYPRFAPTMEWDTAAGQAIAEAAGAEVVNAHTGERLRYNKHDLLNPWFIVRR